MQSCHGSSYNYSLPQPGSHGQVCAGAGMHYKEGIVPLSITAAPSYDYAHPAAAGFSWSVWGGGDTMRR